MSGAPNYKLYLSMISNDVHSSESSKQFIRNLLGQVTYWRLRYIIASPFYYLLVLNFWSLLAATAITRPIPDTCPPLLMTLFDIMLGIQHAPIVKEHYNFGRGYFSNFEMKLSCRPLLQGKIFGKNTPVGANRTTLCNIECQRASKRPSFRRGCGGNKLHY